jgi:hypothetical protein
MFSRRILTIGAVAGLGMAVLTGAAGADRGPDPAPVPVPGQTQGLAIVCAHVDGDHLVVQRWENGEKTTTVRPKDGEPVVVESVPGALAEPALPSVPPVGEATGDTVPPTSPAPEKGLAQVPESSAVPTPTFEEVPSAEAQPSFTQVPESSAVPTPTFEEVPSAGARPLPPDLAAEVEAACGVGVPAERAQRAGEQADGGADSVEVTPPPGDGRS